MESIVKEYFSTRYKFIRDEEELALGGKIKLTENEMKANKILMRAKLEEHDEGFNNPETFLPAIHFFNSKEKIDESKVFQFIQKFPKGSVLHAHDTAMLSAEGLFRLTFTDNLYARTVDNRLQLQFFKTPESNDWKLVSELRIIDPDFDTYLRNQLTLVIPNPKDVYTDINKVWARFTDIFGTATPLITYKPVFKQYFYEALQELYDDNVMYLEFRGTLPTVYDLDGKQYGPLDVVEIYKDVKKKFKDSHPDFIDVVFIYAPSRCVDTEVVDGYIAIAKELLRKHSDFVVGFDLVGQEDLGRPLISFIKELQEIQQDVKIFLHAGETNWYGTSTDENLIDAVLLGTQRIGHGYALSKHPAVLKQVKEREIAIEVCPISNQVLLLVEDMRNHPCSLYISQDYPVVICNDDPGYWGAKGLSYDWYMAFMGIASRKADLKMLKQFAINSIKYSSLDRLNKEIAMAKWTKQWDKFILSVLIENKK